MAHTSGRASLDRWEHYYEHRISSISIVWVATLVAVVGLVGVAVVTQYTGYRLGGTITVPVLAVYALKNFLMLPVFVLSTVAAYLGLWYIKRRTIVYGREELVAAILIGTTVPLLTFLFLLRAGLEFGVVVFIGSILPGLAAYNYHRIKPEYRRNDLLSGIGLSITLIALGWVLVTPELAARAGTLTPPVLFAETADVAVYKGAVVDRTTESIILRREVAAALFVAGLVAAEGLRDRFGVRVGTITAVLLGIYAVASYWLLVLYVLLFVLAYAFAQVVNYLTLRYGRVLLGVTIAVAHLLSVPFTLALPVERGLSAFFVAVLAAVTAYNVHTSAPLDRRLVLPLQTVVAVPTALAARAFGRPGPVGVPQTLSPTVLVVSAVVVGLAFLLARSYVVERPDDEAVVSTSVLSGGGRS
jgi:hypothetical protein